jgi:hypothetical protein
MTHQELLEQSGNTVDSDDNSYWFPEIFIFLVIAIAVILFSLFAPRPNTIVVRQVQVQVFIPVQINKASE